jgi:hypothetical protein
MNQPYLNDRSPVNIEQSGIPVIIPANGTVAATGIITLTIALPVIYPAAWIYLPAGAIAGGAAGLYYCQFTSTTVGKVYAHYVDASLNVRFVPYVQNSPTVAIGSGSAYTQTTSEVNLVSILIPGGTLGPNGMVIADVLGSTLNDANNKTFNIKFSSFYFFTLVLTTAPGLIIKKWFQNRGNSQQVSPPVGNFGCGALTAAIPILGAIDTTQDQYIKLTGQVAVPASDYLVYESFAVQLLPSF